MNGVLSANSPATHHHSNRHSYTHQSSSSHQSPALVQPRYMLINLHFPCHGTTKSSAPTTTRTLSGVKIPVIEWTHFIWTTQSAKTTAVEDGIKCPINIDQQSSRSFLSNNPGLGGRMNEGVGGRVKEDALSDRPAFPGNRGVGLGFGPS